MTFQTPITIATALERIQGHEYVLPAIQREFVWDTDQVSRLFDSLMRGYPIGSFLFWQVKEETTREFVFYDFIRNYHELKAPHCPRLDLPGTRPVTAILDGQQRLTALNIGLRGTHAEKQPRKWRTSFDAYPVKRLHLNIAAAADENELGMEYDFRFLTDKQAQSDNDGGSWWFPVGKIMNFDDATAIFEYVQEAGLATSKQAFKYLNRLHSVVTAERLINYYEEESQDLDKVLNIFIRVNSAGEPLSYSDLLLSIATAQWTDRDAREAIHALVDELNQSPQDFAFSKDLVLKAGLVMCDIGDIRFKVTNFNRTNMAALEASWDTLSMRLRLAARLLSEFGFSDQTLAADSVLVPVAYYVHRRGASESYLNAVQYRDDREAVRRWVIRSLLKSGVWGSGLDTLLLAIRRAIKDGNGDAFPSSAIETAMATRGKALAFQPEEIQDLAETPYGNRKAFAILSLLYPGVSPRNSIHEDHVFPRSLFTKRRLIAAGVAADQVEDYRRRVDSLPNLQLLEGPVNVQKQSALPLAWVTATFPERKARDAYLALHDMQDLPNDLGGFLKFYDHRRGLMATRLGELLGVSTPNPEA